MVKKKGIKGKKDFLQGIDPETADPYNIGGSYSHGDIIDHKVFGIGRVGDLITPNKMVVEFAEGEKILVCVIQRQS